MAEKHTESPALRSFEEVYETSYSHGLESIYRLESIDLKTVKKLGGAEQAPPKATILPKETRDLELDLGPAYSGYLSSFVLKEPIETLKLARHLEKNLKDEGIETLEDLSKLDFALIKGLGRGHAYELQEKLNERLKDEEALKPRKIDINSWARSLVGSLETKVAWALLEPFGLQEALSLTPIESLEIKKLTVERKTDFIDQAVKKVESPDRVKNVRDRLAEIEDVFISPWLLSRGGVAKESELIERLSRVSSEPDKLEGFLKFLKTYITGDTLFHLPGKDGLIYTSAEEWGEFVFLESEVLKCLWNHEAKVEYGELKSWISRELLPLWKELQEKLLNKVIAFSPLIRREKGAKGLLYIKRSIHYIR